MPRAEAPPKLVRCLPAYPVVMVRPARLAVDRSEQGKGLGALLLTEALRKAVAVGEAPPRLVVDAIDDEAAKLYARHGFIAAPGHPLRLYRRMKEIRASLPRPCQRRRNVWLGLFQRITQLACQCHLI